MRAVDTLLSSVIIVLGVRSLRIGSISCQLLKMLVLESKLISVRRLLNILLRFHEESVSTLTGFSS